MNHRRQSGCLFEKTSATKLNHKEQIWIFQKSAFITVYNTTSAAFTVYTAS